MSLVGCRQKTSTIGSFLPPVKRITCLIEDNKRDIHYISGREMFVLSDYYYFTLRIHAFSCNLEVKLTDF